MSQQITNIISTVFRSNAGNALAVMNQVAGGMTNIGRAAFGVGNMSERANAQLRAIGTTLRYAFAGSVVFGTARLVTDLSQIQRQLALIRFLGNFDETAGSAQRARREITDLYGDAQRGALESLTPVSEFNDALINLYSTIEARPGNEMTQLTTALAEGAQLAQTPVDDLTRAISGMNQAFGNDHNLRNYESAIRGFVGFVSRAPGGVSYGPQYIQQLAPLASVSRLAAISPEQMMGLLLTASRTGATPATTGRGLQYLLQSIAVPASEQSSRALAQAGINPQSVQQNGGLWALRQLIAHVRSLGLNNADRLTGLTDDQVDLLESQGDPSRAIRGLGVSGGGLAWMSQAIGRIHGIRALVTLMAQGGQLDNDLTSIAGDMEDTATATHEFRRKWEQFRSDQPLRAAGVSLDILRRQMQTAFEPGFNLIGRQISGVGGFALQHPETTQHGMQAAGGILAALGIGRLFGVRVPGLGRVGRFAGQGAVAAQAAHAAATRGVNGPIGSTPTNPLFVTVVGQLFQGGNVNLPGAGVGGGNAAERRWFQRILPWAAGAGVGVLGTGARAAIRAVPWMARRLGPVSWMQQISPEDAGIFVPPPNTPRNRSYLENLAAARMANRGVQYLYGTEKDQIRGRAMVTLDVLVKQPGHNAERKRIHVPMELWQGTIPGTRGKAGKTTRR